MTELRVLQPLASTWKLLGRRLLCPFCSAGGHTFPGTAPADTRGTSVSPLAPASDQGPQRVGTSGLSFLELVEGHTEKTLSNHPYGVLWIFASPEP